MTFAELSAESFRDAQLLADNYRTRAAANRVYFGVHQALRHYLDGREDPSIYATLSDRRSRWTHASVREWLSRNGEREHADLYSKLYTARLSADYDPGAKLWARQVQRWIAPATKLAAVYTERGS